MSLLEGGNQTRDEAEHVVEGLGVDLAGHLGEAFDDGLEEGERALLGVGLEDLLDLLEILPGLDEVGLGVLADLDEGGAFRAEVHQEPLGFLAGEDGVAVVLELGGVVLVLGAEAVVGVVAALPVAIEGGLV